MPLAAALPIPPAGAFLFTPLEVQATSYLAASVKIFSFSKHPRKSNSLFYLHYNTEHMFLAKRCLVVFFIITIENV
jgi:hypothetical protein